MLPQVLQTVELVNRHELAQHVAAIPGALSTDVQRILCKAGNTSGVKSQRPGPEQEPEGAQEEEEEQEEQAQEEQARGAQDEQEAQDAQEAQEVQQVAAVGEWSSTPEPPPPGECSPKEWQARPPWPTSTPPRLPWPTSPPGRTTSPSVERAERNRPLECTTSVEVQPQPEVAEPAVASSNTSRDRNSSELIVGQRFENFKAVKDALEVYQRNNFVVLVTQDSRRMPEQSPCPYKFVKYKCVHGGRPKKQEKKRKRGYRARPNQFILPSGCPCSLTVRYDLKLCAYVLRHFNPNHNHERSRSHHALYNQNRRLTPAEEDKYINVAMGKYGSRNGIVRKEVHTDTGKFLSTMDVYNACRRAGITSQSASAEDFVAYMKARHEEDAGSCLRVVHADSHGKRGTQADTIKALFWQSSSMRAALETSPDVLFMDSTYNVSKTNYSLMVITCMSPLGRTRIVAWSFMSNETSHLLQEVLSLFKEANSLPLSNLKSVVVDKDFTEIGCISDVFPEAHYYICRFHALQTIRRKVHQLHLPKELADEKHRLLSLFGVMVNADTEEAYQEAYREMCSVAMASEEIAEFTDYIERNWHVHREHFAQHVLKHRPLFGNATNNRAENVNSQIKKWIPKKTDMVSAAKALFDLENDMDRTHLRELHNSTLKVFQPHTSETDKIRQDVSDACEQLVLRPTLLRVLRQFDDIKNVLEVDLHLAPNQVVCPRKERACAFNGNMQLPCSHLMYVRLKNNEPVVTEVMFGERWLRDRVEQTPSTNATSRIFRTLSAKKASQRTKFNDSTLMLRGLAGTLSQMPEQERVDCLQKLDKIQSIVNNDQDFVVSAVPSQEAEDTLQLLAEEDQPAADGERSLQFSPKKVGTCLPGQQFTKKRKSETVKERVEPEDEWKSAMANTCAKLDLNPWTENEFQAFIPGGKSWLTDQHVDVMMKLLHLQHPHVQESQSTLFGDTLRGFKTVDLSRDYIQILHADYHWVVATNIGVPQDRRLREVRLYDSLIRLQADTDLSFHLVPKLSWFMAELLRSSARESHDSFDVRMMPCQQQPNTYDCGVFAIANAITLANNVSPEDIVYVGDMRQQMKAMVVAGRSEPFQHRQKDSNNDPQFRQEVRRGNLKSRVALTEMTQRVAVICDCRLPADRDDVVLCDLCNEQYHQKCYLLGRPNVKKSLAEETKFLCCYCRQPGSYPNVEGAKPADPNAVDDMCKKIDEMSAATLSNFLQASKYVVITDLPFEISGYKKLEALWCKYDVNKITSGQGGQLYDALYNKMEKHKSSLAGGGFSGGGEALSTLNRSQLLRLMSQLLALLDGVVIAGFRPHTVGSETFIEVDENGGRQAMNLVEVKAPLGKVITEYRPWVRTVNVQAKRATRQVNALQKMDPQSDKALDQKGTAKITVREVLQSVKQVRAAFANAENVSRSKRQLAARRKILAAADEAEKLVLSAQADILKFEDEGH